VIVDNDEVISILNDLIETSKDGEEGFRTCAADISDPQLKTLFSNRAQSCAMAAEELQQLVRTYGGDPETSGGFGGALHRRWVDIKAVIAGRSEQAVLEECERGEDMAVRSYRNALERRLPPEVRALVERQYQGVLNNHDMVRGWREKYRAA
jgi:uncharacterized protein (TIGR02284 family)